MKKSIALITTILMTALLTILIGTTLFLVSRGIFVTGGEERFVTALSASEGGIERGVWKIKRYMEGNDELNPENYRIGSFNVRVSPEAVSGYARVGFSLRFAAAYLGYGYTSKGGGVAQIYLISSSANHPQGTRAAVEALMKIPIGSPGGE